MNSVRERLSPLFISVAVAALLMIIPLPELLVPLRPFWVALVLIFWCLETQDMVSLDGAFLIGLLLDLLTDSLLGMHALELVVLVYLVKRFRARLRFFPPWQQALSVLALLVNDRIIVLWIVSLRGDALPPLSYWLSPVIGTVLWPWIFLIMDRYRSLARVRTAS